MSLRTILIATVLAIHSSTATVSMGQSDKGGYTLFNPVRRESMREMNTDRPDTTESPYTVDAGHFQYEFSLIDYTYNDDRGVETRTFNVMSSNLKVGLLNNVDVQFVFMPYTHVEAEADGAKDSADGFGDDTQVRLKINLWGNDSGDAAFALMPFVKFPTGSDELSNDHVEGGLIIPFAVKLPNDFSLGLMAEIDAVYNEGSGGYGTEFVHTATVSHPIGELSGYVEYVGVAPNDTDSTYRASASGGLVYALSDDWNLDCGGLVGLSDSADDFTLFAGMSIRF
jgi:hypothetical protein